MKLSERFTEMEAKPDAPQIDRWDGVERRDTLTAEESDMEWRFLKYQNRITASHNWRHMVRTR